MELLVVLAIGAGLVALAPWAYSSLKRASEYRSTVRLMTADLAAARRDAVASGKVVGFFVDVTGREFGVEGGIKHKIPADLQVRVTIADVDYSEGVARIRFFPMGSTTGGSVEVLRSPGVGARLQADWLDGRISVEALAR